VRARVAIWASRIVVLAVFIINVQCAVSFLIWPGDAASAYGLSGIGGQAAVCGIAVAFLMWNVTYPLVILWPQKNVKLFVIVLIQQAVGLVGELAILASVLAQASGQGVSGADYAQCTQLASGITRFIAFDAAGLVLMAAAFVFLVLTHRRSRPQR
jgi:hypothetical protein